MLDLTLPGTLPDLLRVTSPIVLQTGSGLARGVVVGPAMDLAAPGSWEVAWTPLEGDLGATLDDLPLSALHLDLSNETGRTHALWWAGVRVLENPDFYPTDQENIVIDKVRYGLPCTEDEVVTFRGLCLRLRIRRTPDAKP